MNNGLNLGTALILAAGLALAGWFVGHGFIQGRTADRFVTVKGIAERELASNIALWPLRYTATDDDLGRAQAAIQASTQAILAFLARHGIGPEQTEIQGLEVNDQLANPYRSGPLDSRFIISQTLMVRSEDAALVNQVSQRVGELVDAGVILTNPGGFSSGPTFLFTELNALKPSMIAEATANARAAAEQFAQDSGSRLGPIRNANQGVFVILPRDQAPGVMENSQLHKTVRVVSTIEYYLED